MCSPSNDLPRLPCLPSDLGEKNMTLLKTLAIAATGLVLSFGAAEAAGATMTAMASMSKSFPGAWAS